MKTARIRNLLIKDQPSRGRTRVTQHLVTTQALNPQGPIPTRRHSLRAPTAIRHRHAAVHPHARATAIRLQEVHPQDREAAILHRGVHRQDPAEAIHLPGARRQVRVEAHRVVAAVLHQVQVAVAADKQIKTRYKSLVLRPANQNGSILIDPWIAGYFLPKFNCHEKDTCIH